MVKNKVCKIITVIASALAALFLVLGLVILTITAYDIELSESVIIFLAAMLILSIVLGLYFFIAAAVTAIIWDVKYCGYVMPAAAALAIAFFIVNAVFIKQQPRTMYFTPAIITGCVFLIMAVVLAMITCGLTLRPVINCYKKSNIRPKSAITEMCVATFAAIYIIGFSIALLAEAFSNSSSINSRGNNFNFLRDGLYGGNYIAHFALVVVFGFAGIIATYFLLFEKIDLDNKLEFSNEEINT